MENKNHSFHKDSEVRDLIEEMKRIGYERFQTIFGGEVFETIKQLAKEEERLNPIRQKIRLQAKLKNEIPMCEKCVFWKAKERTCPYNDLEKAITFEPNDLFQESIDIELCEMFEWEKINKT